MNLLFRISLLFVGASFLVFLVGGVISYQVMKREVDSEQQRFLLERLDRIDNMIKKRKPRDSVKHHQLLIVPLQSKQQESISFSDTVVMHAQLNRLEPHLKLTAIKNVNNKSYYVSIYGVIVETDDIVDAVTESMIKIYLILLVVIILIGSVASYYILRPFRETLVVIKNFSIKEPKKELIFPKSNVKEFKKLNSFLEEMTEKVHHDYSLLKEFSENASHELQTPIAIIQSKLEVLMDGQNLTEEQISQISQTQNAVRRLSNLSNSLGLLTKIDNQEFSNPEDIDLSATIRAVMEEFIELIQLKSISLTSQIDENIHIKADRVLIELLLTNLINNAMRHNWENGELNMKLTPGELTIENTGAQLDIDPNSLFERFKKSNQSNRSMGLGLAIVKKICDLYSYDISYLQSNKMHTLRIKF